MASELYVETLKGLTSGANANKVIVPAGQTLDITDWSPPAGTVLQVVESSNSTQIVTTSSSFVTANLSASITPVATSSKVLIIVSYQGGPVDNGAADAYAAFGITKDSGSTFLTKAGIRGYDYGGSGSIVFTGNILTYYDSPSTTSEITYAVYHRLNSGDSLYANTQGPGSDQTVSNIILMEIAG